MAVDDQRWERHPRAAFVVRGVVLMAPLAAAIGAGMAFGHFAPPPTGILRGTAWWSVVFIVSALVLVVVDRLVRRLLSVALLLDLALLFPERAPSRFKIALRSGSVKSLEQYANRIAVATDATPGEHAATVLTFVIALNTHDRRTRGHSERVRALTEVVATKLNLPDADAERLRWAALLHDIGKLTVPAAILNKPAAPNAVELAKLRGHPAAGGRIAAPLAPWMGEWFHAIDQHHERYDGEGYPNGLHGDAISLAGRIVAVTDAFETMTAVRSYKRAMKISDARRELARCSGSHFDPQIVRAVVDISVARLYWTLPLAWLADIPIIGLAPRAVVAVGQHFAFNGAAVASVIGAAGIGLGVVAIAPPSSAPHPSIGQAEAAPGPSGEPTPSAPAGTTPASEPTPPPITSPPLAGDTPAPVPAPPAEVDAGAAGAALPGSLPPLPTSPLAGLLALAGVGTGGIAPIDVPLPGL